MKILYVYDKMPDTYQRYLLNLLNLVKSSLQVKTLAYLDNVDLDYFIKSYGLKDCIQRFLYKFNLTKHKSLDVIVFNKFELIHIQHSYLFSKVLPLFNQSQRPKIVVTLRGGDTYLKPWKDKKWIDFYSNEGKLIDAFITMSQHQKEYLTKWGIVAEKIHVVPVSFGIYSEAKPKYPNRDKLKLVSAFRMTWEKNIEGSIQFANLLKEKGVNFQYDIYGDGQDLSQFYYLVDRYDLKQHINIKGKVDNDILKSSLIDYDFFLQLSISEALSVSVLEAQSVGLPCVVSDSGGLPEALLHGKTAIVYPYTQLVTLVEEILKIWKDKEVYFTYSQNAICFVNNNFTLQHEEKKLKELYISLME